MDFLGLDLPSLVKAVGYLGMFAIIFAESGLFIGFILPGDSLIFTAGVLASQGFLNIFLLVGVIFAGAILGDNFGYAFGKKTGSHIFKREDSFFFHKDHVERARMFYESHGPKTIVLARFLPVIRTFAPIVAGVGHMNYSTFFFYNFLGGVLWAVGLPLIGFFLGTAIPDIDQYLIPIVLGIIFLSVAGTGFNIIAERHKHGRT